jgi:hypothetical protein
MAAGMVPAGDGPGMASTLAAPQASVVTRPG